MAFKIREEEALGESIRRVACEEISKAIEASRATPNGKGSPVHETRKHLKKARAAMRLLRTEVKRDCFKQEHHRLRDVGRVISHVRDAEVRLQTVKRLREASDGSRSFAETEELLAFELDSFLAAFSGWQEEAARKLSLAQSGIAHWRLHRLTRGQVCRTVRKSYGEGRHALKRARKSGEASDFHELRKQAKELSYQMRLLRPLEPVVFSELCHSLKTLGEQLGHAHDLCFVAERLESIAGGEGSKRGRRALRALIDAREEDLQRTALTLAKQFYAAKPKEFSGRIARYFEEPRRAIADADTSLLVAV